MATEITNNSPHLRDNTQSHEYRRIKRILLVCMVLVPFVPFLLVLLTGYYYFSSSIERSTLEGMKRILQDHQTIVSSFLKERQAALNLMLNTNDITALRDSQYLEEIYTTLNQNDQAVTDIGVFDAAGNHLAYQGPYKGLLEKSYKDAEWFRAVRRDGRYVSDVFLGYRNAPHFIIAAARNVAGETFVLRATIDMRVFDDLVKSIRIGKTGEAFIVNHEGILQTKDATVGPILTPARYTPPMPAAADQVITAVRTDEDGKKYIYAGVRINAKNWFLIVKQEIKDAFHALRQAILLTVVIAVLGGMLIVGLAIYITNRIIHTLTALRAEKNTAQNQLIRAGRLSELGQMAAGFAHEINNPLQIIASEQALIRSDLNEMIDRGELHSSDLLTEISDSMDQIKLQISRCAKITQAILKFARKEEPKIQQIILLDLIPEIVSLVERKARVNGIEIAQNLSPGLPEIAGDPSQLQQVLLNLLNNGIDAITEKNGQTGGRLEVSAEMDGGDQVAIRVGDNGAGIDDADKEKIFLPFFTTKPPGKGTGLGLSVCYAIIQGMEGNLSFTSEKGRGTTFVIRLPLIRMT